MPSLRPLNSITPVDPRVLLHWSSAEDAARAVYDASHSAAIVSVEMMWPALSVMADQMGTDPILQDGWQLRSIPSPEDQRKILVLEDLAGSGGYLLEMKDKQGFPKDSTGVAPIEFLQCTAFSGEGIGRDRIDGDSLFRLDTLVRLSSEPEDFVLGRVFAIRTDPILSFDGSAEIAISRSLDDMGLSISILHRLGSFLKESGFAPVVGRRLEAVEGAVYKHYGENSRTPAFEIGAHGVVCDGGLVGESTLSQLVKLWRLSCNRIVSDASSAVGSIIRQLRDGGHVDHDSRFSAYGDHLHLQEKSASSGTLVVTTETGDYHLDFMTDGDGLVRECKLLTLDDDGHASTIGDYRISVQGEVVASTMTNVDFFQRDAVRQLSDATRAIKMSCEALNEYQIRRYMRAY